MSRLRTSLGVFVLVLLFTAVARADGNADEAELQFQLGAEAYQHATFREALAHFLASNRLVPNRNVRFNIARTYERLTQFPDAYRWYLDALDGETDATIIATIHDALARIAPNVAVLDVTSDPPGATLYIDRKDLGSVALAPRQIALAPGTYGVIASLPGFDDATATALVAQVGHVTPVSLQLVRIVGHVTVAADPGTTVHLDDENAPAACAAPCTFDVAPGVHLLYFRRDGFRVNPRQVTVVAAQTANVSATGTPVTGSILVEADERDASSRSTATPSVVLRSLSRTSASAAGRSASASAASPPRHARSRSTKTSRPTSARSTSPRSTRSRRSRKSRSRSTTRRPLSAS